MTAHACTADKFSRRASIFMVLMLLVGAILGKRDSNVLHAENELAKEQRALLLEYSEDFRVVRARNLPRLDDFERRITALEAEIVRLNGVAVTGKD